MDAEHDHRPGNPGGPLWDPDAVPASTVVVLRDATDGPEVLMLRRDRALSFAGGMWVFPGGRVDAADHLDGHHETPSALDDELARLELAARRAAVREAAEEAGLALQVESLHRWSHWTPPPESPKRFSTAFFVAALPDGAAEVVVDDGEIREHRWMRPDDVLQRRDSGEVGLTPPTFITLVQIGEHASVADVIAHAASRSLPEHFATRVCFDGDEVIALYHGDAAYDSGELAPDGPRHRLRMGSSWHYERRP